MSRFGFIQAQKAAYPIALACRVLEVSRAGYYAWVRRSPSARARADGELTERIRQVHVQSRATYGAPRIQAELAATACRVGRKRVGRLMRQAGLVGCSRRRQTIRTTVADPAAMPWPNVVARQFAAPTLDRLWVGDITYVPTHEGWLYLAVLLDACSRRVVGWAMADHLRTELALDALQMAIRRRQPAPGDLVHHTDRGCQYTAAAYRAVLADQAITGSMSRAANCYDNAMAESFFGTLKAELLDRRSWATRAAARQAIFEWIEVFYNRQRRHSALGFLSPAAFEGRWAEGQAA
jgi:putative transposase